MVTYEDLLSGSQKIAVIGLGYVGLPLAVELSKHFSIIGFDISENKIADLAKNIDRTNEVDSESLRACSVQFTSLPDSIGEASLFIVTVPTPIDRQNRPDLSAVQKATEMISAILPKGAVVVYESTVYPGVTEDICGKIIQETTGFSLNESFYLGYSPERLSPGEKERTLTKVVKVVSGSTPEVTDLLARVYGAVVEAGVFCAESIRVAEAAKVIENTQRDLNVALMNELSIIFNKLGIDTLSVIEAASTKWNFIKMAPGLVGGHCIGVDPYYLTFKAQELGYHPQVILSGRRINDSMGKYIAEQTIKKLIKVGKSVKNSKIGIFGITFKENVSDIRNSKVIDIINELNEYGVEVLVTDPLASQEETIEEYGIELSSTSDLTDLDAIIFSVNHTFYREKPPEYFLDLFRCGSTGNPVFIDVKGVFRHEVKISQFCEYFSL